MGNRIEEVKEIPCPDCNGAGRITLDFFYKSGQLGYGSTHPEEVVCRRCKGTGQIRQLFPQPLDDKELREKIASKFRLCKGKLCVNQEEYGFADQILALLQPKIEEARRQERERVKGELVVLFPKLIRDKELAGLIIELVLKDVQSKNKATS